MFAIRSLRRPTWALSRVFRLTRPSLRWFSSQEGETPEYTPPDIPEPTEEEKQKYRDAWGLKYQDECYKFEKEWEKIAEDRDVNQIKALEEELNSNEVAKVEFLADKILRLNMFEMRYLASIIKKRIKNTSGINPLKLNMDWPSIKQEADGTWPPLNPNWFKQQELMAKVGPFLNSMGAGVGGGQSTPAGENQAEGAEEAKKEETVKSHFDIELTSFDAKSKIKIIKELRSILGLGLKEAKETVESAPVWLKKEVKKEEAEGLKEKIEGLGGEIKLV